MTPQQILELAIQRQNAGQFSEAEALYRQLLAVQPGEPQVVRRLIEVTFQLGNVLRNAGLLNEAGEAYRRVVALQPDFATAFNNLGMCHAMQNQLDAAIAAFRQAAALQPAVLGFQMNLGTACSCLGNHDEAIAAYRNAVAISPDNADAWCNLGNSLSEKNAITEAMQAYEKALALRPDFALAHLNLGLALIQIGDFARGWREFEWRLQIPDLQLARTFSQPRWNGQDATGKTILVYAEGGFGRPDGGYGETIFFCRFASLVAQRGAQVILECQPALVRLLKSVPGVSTAVARGEPLPPFDLRIPMESLPFLFETTLKTVPNRVPYLFPQPELAEQWKQKLGNDQCLKIGLVWAGSGGTYRTNQLQLFAPLADVPGARFLSLQKGSESSQTPPAGLVLTDFTRELGDFADTAALISQLDLVISIDTAVAHLAGAMGKPAWVIIPRRYDFHRLMDQSESPWYPTMRYFVQSHSGDWRAPVDEIARALRSWVDEGASRE